LNAIKTSKPVSRAFRNQCDNHPCSFTWLQVWSNVPWMTIATKQQFMAYQKPYMGGTHLRKCIVCDNITYLLLAPGIQKLGPSPHTAVVCYGWVYSL
jgi:hypothetical protein